MHQAAADDRHTLSGSLFRSLSVLALCGHAIILVATPLVGIRPLVIINIASVLLYATAVVLNRRRWYLVVLAIGLVEVTAHAVVVAAAMRGSLRAQDTVARWGGEEFLIILPGTDFEGVSVAAEKVLKLADRALYEGKGGGRNRVRAAT